EAPYRVTPLSQRLIEDSGEPVAGLCDLLAHQWVRLLFVGRSQSGYGSCRDLGKTAVYDLHGGAVRLVGPFLHGTLRPLLMPFHGLAQECGEQLIGGA